MKVIDLYHEDVIADFKLMSANTEFLIHKVCQNKIDEKCKIRFEKAESLKLPYWGYVFLDKGEWKSQIDRLIKCVKDWDLLSKKYFIGLILDIEDHQSLEEAQWAYGYLADYCSKKSIKMGIYYGHQDADKLLPLIKQANKEDVFTWCARYNIIKPAHYGLVDLWQFSDKELIHGMSKGCDCSMLTGRRPTKWFLTQLKNENSTKGADTMAVRIGSARINENGKINGGAKGDQTGNEVGFQNWYLHNKGWYVLRPKDKNKAEKIALCMEKACNNNKIGYCQDHRYDLLSASKPYGYDPAKVTSKVEVDCSELVRVCCKYAGINVGDFSTADEKATLKATGEFDVLTDSKYCSQSAYLKRGDILVTRTKGHTVVVLSDGKNITQGITGGKTYAEANKGCYLPKTMHERGWWKKGDEHIDCLRIKKFLAWVYPKAGFQNNNEYFGDLTEKYVKEFQKSQGLTPDGEWGEDTQTKAKEFRK